MREPAYTCPLINKALKKIEKAMNWLYEMELTLESFSKNKSKIVLEKVVKSYEALHQAYHVDLEKIRTENTKLRAWGNHYKDRSRQLAKVVKGYKRKWQSVNLSKAHEEGLKTNGT